MSRKAEIFFDAVTFLPEKIVEEAQGYAFRKRSAAWKKFGSLAACLALAASLGLLAVLPRGCGAGGGNDAAPPMAGESVSTDTAAPRDEPQEPADGGYGSGGVESVQFTAKVIEVLDTGTRPAVLVEPLEGEAVRNSADRIVVSVDGEMPLLEAGDLVRVTYDGWIQESYHAGIPNAQSVEKLENG